jgi:hypothetical protein
MTYRAITGGFLAISLTCSTVALAVPGDAGSASDDKADDVQRNPLIVPDTPPAFDLATKQAKRFTLAPGLSAEVFAAEPQLSNPVAMCTVE